MHVRKWFYNILIFRIEGLDSDVRALIEKYRDLPSEAQVNELLKDFETRWEYGREKLTQKLTRVRV